MYKESIAKFLDDYIPRVGQSCAGERSYEIMCDIIMRLKQEEFETVGQVRLSCLVAFSDEFTRYTKRCNSVGMMYIVNKLFPVVGHVIDSTSGFCCEDYAILRFVPQEIETMIDELTEYLADKIETENRGS